MGSSTGCPKKTIYGVVLFIFFRKNISSVGKMAADGTFEYMKPNGAMLPKPGTVVSIKFFFENHLKGFK